MFKVVKNGAYKGRDHHAESMERREIVEET